MGTPHPARVREWAFVALAGAAAVALWNVRGRSRRAGDLVDAPISVVTADGDNLGCALDRAVERFRCGPGPTAARWRWPPRRSWRPT